MDSCHLMILYKKKKLPTCIGHICHATMFIPYSKVSLNSDAANVLYSITITSMLLKVCYHCKLLLDINQLYTNKELNHRRNTIQINSQRGACDLNIINDNAQLYSNASK